MASKNKLFSFKYNQEHLAEQVQGYSTLKFAKTARGQCVMFFLILNIFSLIVTPFLNITEFSFSSALIEFVILYAPLLFLVSKGYRWAIIGLAILWSADKAYTTYYLATHGMSNITSLFFLIIGIALCSKALQVETARKKKPALI